MHEAYAIRPLGHSSTQFRASWANVTELPMQLQCKCIVQVFFLKEVQCRQPTPPSTQP
jgi:hypothetical protein